MKSLQLGLIVDTNASIARIMKCQSNNISFFSTIIMENLLIILSDELLFLFKKI